MTDTSPPRSAATKVLDVLSALARSPGHHRIVDLAAWPAEANGPIGWQDRDHDYLRSA